MTNQPKYFERVRAKAALRWDQFEADDELAAASWQLFAQVQNPRHVVSELLQNADDAGATEATVEIKDGEFVFSHDGDDFTEDQFASLCRFGYSNKRTMWTIGFRGIGFKSTFSLADEVYLISPTLSVMFRRKRFYEPVWIDRRRPSSGSTEVRVRIKDKHRLTELQKNLSEWMTTPASLLFFKTIRKLRIQDEEVHWKSHGEGPVDGSEWMATSKSPRQRYLVLRSAFEELPSEAQEEIRHERMVGVDGKLDLPKCQVELVLGPDRGPDLEGRLFVVLPTQVTTALPFACNAPFIQDPVRLQIKDPAISPTNRWLLERVGEFAGSAMLDWLKCSKIEVAERCEAYSLVPDIDPEDEYGEDDDQAPDSLIQEAFDDAINEKAFLMTEQGKLRPQDGCVAIPAELVDVWSASAISELLGDDEKPILNRHIAEANVEKLAHREFVTRLDKNKIIQTLDASVPKPKSWPQLLQLWSFIADEVTQDTYWTKRIRIFPAKGSPELHQAADVTRVAEKRLLHSADDWEFLSTYARVLDQNWLRFLAEQRRKAESTGDKQLLKKVKSAYAILKALELDETSEVGRLIENASKQFTTDVDEVAPEECVRLAHIVAALAAPVPEDFTFLTCDGLRTEANYGVLAALTSDLAELADADWWDEHVLHEDYTRKFASCSESEWKKWVASEASRLLMFAPIELLDDDDSKIRGRTQIEALLEERGATNPPVYPYTTSNNFECTDWDFEDKLWRHWQAIASTDENVWSRIGSQILAQPQRYWSEKLNCKIRQISGGARRPITNEKEKLDSRWICKLRKLRCLEDTKGGFHLPSSLMRRTAQNESLLSVEAFVRKEFDTEENRPLLDALGVRTKAAGVEGLLDRLRNFDAGQNASIDEVLGLYRHLDEVFASQSMKDREHVRDVFSKEALIRTADNKWTYSSAVYLGSNEIDFPGTAIIHSAVRHLTMWTKIGVAAHPTVELILERFNSFKSGQRLSPNDLQVVQTHLPQHPDRVWSDCGHWLNLAGEWAPVKSLKYALADDSFPLEHLHSQVKQKTADFRRLQIDTRQNPPFSGVPTLAACLEERPAKLPKPLSKAEFKPWLVALGNGLQRVQRANQEDTDSVRDLGKRLAATAWQVVAEIEIVPFIEGQRAGDPRKIEAFWNDALLYVADHAAAKMPKPIAGLLGRGFGADISEAINFCYDREPAKIMVYLEANFSLASAEKSQPAASDRDKIEDSGESLETNVTGASALATVADAIQSLLDTDATSPTPMPGELDRPDRPTSSRPASRTGTRSTSPSPNDDDDGDERDDSGDGETRSRDSRRRGERPGYSVLHSYVVPDRPEDSSPTDNEGQTHRTETGQAGVNRVLEYERGKGRTPREMPPNHPGYDVESSNGSVDVERYIEVKSLSGDWRGPDAGMTPKQFEKAAKDGDRYWLYVVERAQQDDFRLHCIRDPAGKVNRFMFDPEWKKVAEGGIKGSGLFV